MNLKEIWSIQTHKRILSIEFGDINGDSELEIICGFSDGYLGLFSMRGKQLKFIQISENEPLYHIKKFDLFEYRKSQLIIGGKDGILRIFDISSDLSFNLLWSLKFNSLIAGILIDDINNDGIYEIISYSLDKTIRVLNPKDGSLIWGQVFEKGIGDCLIWSSYWK
jgi:WD40 repeat protein